MKWRPIRFLPILPGLLLACADHGGGPPAGGDPGDTSAPPVLSAEEERRLRALPYAVWSDNEVDDGNPSGVVTHDPDRVQEGINLYRSVNLETTTLMDEDGRVLRELDAERQLIKPWREAEFLFLGGSVGSMDLQGRILWENRLESHHDITWDDEGRLYTLLHRRVFLEPLGDDVPIDDNPIAILDSRGRIQREISIARLVLDSPDRPLLEGYYAEWRPTYGQEKENAEEERKNGLDVLHTNTVEVLRRDYLRDGERLFGSGDLLISIRKLDLVAVVDLGWEQGDARIVWSWGPGEVEQQHQPTFLENGNLLIFDNGSDRGYSRVVELDPVTETLQWEYVADPPESFYSFSRGGAERMPNGNTLITESNKGHVFEVTPDGTVVWEFWNPEIQDGKRATIYRFSRITDPIFLRSLRDPRTASP